MGKPDASPIGGARFYVAVSVAALLTFVLHEAAHAVAGIALPVVVLAVLLAMTWSAGRQLRARWTTNAAAYGLCSVSFVAIVFGAAAFEAS